MADQPSERPDEVAAISALGEPTRRALYEHIAAVGDWTSRDDAADALGIERGTAVHHLDRLAADGLLDVQFRRLSGRRGPGAGRPAKLYRRAARQLDVSLPPRDYELAGRMLAEAVDRARASGTDVVEALDEVASAEGRRLAEDIDRRLRDARVRRPASRRRVVLEALEDHGYEPRAVDRDTVVLRNCPFHKLARQHTELVCGMNLCLLRAAVDSVEDAGFEARLEPEPEQCCVKLHTTDRDEMPL